MLIIYLVNSIQVDFFKLSRLTLHLKKFNPFIFIVITDMVGVIYVP